MHAILVLLAVGPACGIQRVAGYVDELERDTASSSETTDTTESVGSSGDTGDTGTSAGPASSAHTSDTTAATQAGSESAASSETTASAETTRATTDETTAEPTPTCGNAVLEAFGAEPEECDDGNLDPLDGCSATCALDRRAFVSSLSYTAGQLKSLYIADALCANLADDQGWPDGLSYRAWLSDSTTDARDRFDRGRGRLVLANGLVLAASWSALLTGALDNPFEVTEKSTTYHGRAWTGTRPDGTAVPGAQHCDDWSTDSIFKTGHYGYSDRTTPEWTLADDKPSGCNLDYALYCLQSL